MKLEDWGGVIFLFIFCLIIYENSGGSNPDFITSLSYKINGNSTNEIQHYGDIITYTYVINNTGDTNFTDLNNPCILNIGNNNHYYEENKTLYGKDFVETFSNDRILEPGESWIYTFNHTFDKKDITDLDTLHNHTLKVEATSTLNYLDKADDHYKQIGKNTTTNTVINKSMNLFLTKDEGKITLYENLISTNTTYDNIINFIKSSEIVETVNHKFHDEYGNSSSSDLSSSYFAEELHNEAEAAGIRCDLVYIESREKRPESGSFDNPFGSTIYYYDYVNYFDTTDKGRIYIDTHWGDIAVFDEEPKIGSYATAHMFNGTTIKSVVPIDSIEYFD